MKRIPPDDDQGAISDDDTGFAVVVEISKFNTKSRHKVEVALAEHMSIDDSFQDNAAAKHVLKGAVYPIADEPSSAIAQRLAEVVWFVLQEFKQIVVVLNREEKDETHTFDQESLFFELMTR